MHKLEKIALSVGVVGILALAGVGYNLREQTKGPLDSDVLKVMDASKSKAYELYQWKDEEIQKINNAFDEKYKTITADSEFISARKKYMDYERTRADGIMYYVFAGGVAALYGFYGLTKFKLGREILRAGSRFPGLDREMK